MAVHHKLRALAVGIALLVCAIISPLRAEGQTAAQIDTDIKFLCDRANETLNGDGKTPGLIRRQALIANDIFDLKNRLQAEQDWLEELGQAIVLRGYGTTGYGIGQSNEQLQKNVVSSLNSAVQVLKHTQDQIKAASDNQAQIAEQIEYVKKLALATCPPAKTVASAGPTLNTKITTPVETAANPVLGSPVAQPKPSAAKPAAPLSFPTTLVGTWTLSTGGGCEFAGGFKPGVTHKPDGSMVIVRVNTSSNFSRINGGQIDSVVESWTVSGANVSLVVHPTSYFDDPVTNPPKNKFAGGWASRLQLKGTISSDGKTVSGSIFHDSAQTVCSFKMIR